VVPDDTDFLTLLALAGGPKEDAKLSKIRIIHAQEIAVVDTVDARVRPYRSPGSSNLPGLHP
jgi:hypothetical protein